MLDQMCAVILSLYTAQLETDNSLSRSLASRINVPGKLPDTIERFLPLKESALYLSPEDNTGG